MTLFNLTELLKLVTEDCYELEAPPGLTRYIVWHHYNDQRLHGDDQPVYRAERVQADVYWQRSGDPILTDVENVLSYFRLPYELQDIIWDDDRKLNRAIIQLTVV